MQSILKKSILFYLRFLARKVISKHHPVIIGIAGSVGKTSARNALYAILKDHFPTKYIGNSETGIPLGILGIVPNGFTKQDWLWMLLRAPFSLNFLNGTKYLIVEMGIDEPFPPKNMEYLLTILTPDIAIQLNAAATHTMQFEKALGARQKEKNSREKLAILQQMIAREDGKILTIAKPKTYIYNADDLFISDVILNSIQNQKKIPDQVRDDMPTMLTFGKEKTNSISYGEYSVSLEGTKFELYVKQNANMTRLPLHFHGMIIPKVYQEVFASAILAAQLTGVTLEQCKAALEKNFTLPKGRSSLLNGIHNSTIIDSSYNASKAATITFFELLLMLKRKTKRPIVFLFGDMRELGHEGKIEHEEVAEKIIGVIDYLYCVGPLTREYVLPVVQRSEEQFKEIRWFTNAKYAGEFLKENLPKDAIILVKGSQNTIFLEEAVKYILADNKDAVKLCRQEEYWMKIKSTRIIT